MPRLCSAFEQKQQTWNLLAPSLTNFILEKVRDWAERWFGEIEAANQHWTVAGKFWIENVAIRCRDRKTRDILCSLAIFSQAPCMTHGKHRRKMWFWANQQVKPYCWTSFEQKRLERLRRSIWIVSWTEQRQEDQAHQWVVYKIWICTLCAGPENRKT